VAWQQREAARRAASRAEAAASSPYGEDSPDLGALREAVQELARAVYELADDAEATDNAVGRLYDERV
jgi:hypothetical protein